MTLSITPVYIALFALMLIPMTFYIGSYRRAQQISLGDGGDEILQRRVRAHANYIETVPMALLLLLALELTGASAVFIHALALVLAIARLLHYLQITHLCKPLAFRMAGTLLTLLVYLVSGGCLLATAL